MNSEPKNADPSPKTPTSVAAIGSDVIDTGRHPRDELRETVYLVFGLLLPDCWRAGGAALTSSPSRPLPR